MKKLIASLLFLLGTLVLYAQSGVNETISDRAYMFRNMNLPQVETGILSDYGFNWFPPEAFNGELNDSNYVDKAVLEALYIGLYDSQVNQRSSMDGVERVKSRMNDASSLNILFYEYNRIDPNALENGWITVENDQINPVPGKPSPYIKDYCFAVAPGCAEYASNRIRIDASNYFTNTDVTVSNIEIKCEDGGFERFESGQPWEHTFANGGEHVLTCRITFSDGRTMLSRGIVRTSAPKPVRSSKLSAEVFKAIPADATQAGATLQVLYLNKEMTSGKFVRPLVIAGDMDFSVLFGGGTVDLNTLLSTVGVGEKVEELSKIFDIIYVKYNDSADDLLKNGELFRRVIKEVNANRFAFSDKTYVVGLGVGGVISRIGLNLMENAGEDHQVCKMIAVNSPFRGINIPLDLQYLFRQFYSIGFQLEENEQGQYGVKAMAMKYTDFLDKEAVRQLSIYAVDADFEMQNSLYADFMKNKLVRDLPKNCENIAIANGYNGRDKFMVQPYSQLISLDSNRIFKGVKVLKGGWAKLYFNVQTLPYRKQTIFYDSDVWIYLKRFGVKKTYAHDIRKVTSTAEMLPLDSYAGVAIPKFSLKVVNLIPQIDIMQDLCFVPISSSLDAETETYYSNQFKAEEFVPFDRFYRGKSACFGDYSEIFPFLIKELTPHIEGKTHDILGSTELTVKNVPVLPIIGYEWKLKNDLFKVVTAFDATAIVAPFSHGKNVEDVVTVTPKLMLPVGGIDFSQLSVSENLSAYHIYIKGSDYISTADNFYELSAFPENVERISWRASEGVTFREVEKGGIAASIDRRYASSSPWIEATFNSVGVNHAVRKNLEIAVVDSITITEVRSWYNPNHKSTKYHFRVNVYPDTVSVHELNFCWENTVTVKGENSTEEPVDVGGFPDYLPEDSLENLNPILGGNGDAEITTPADIGRCEFRYVDLPMVTDTVLKVMEGPVTIIRPTAQVQSIVVEPAIVVPNEALVAMPTVGYGEVASGFVTCYVSDDFGNGCKVSAYVEAKMRQGGYHVSPNPANQTLVVLRDGTSVASGRMSLCSADSVKGGEAIALLYNDRTVVREMTVGSDVSGVQMDVSDLPTGTYYLNIVENGEVVERLTVLIKH